MHKNVNLTEVDVADKLLEFRSVQDGFIDTSFDTISGMVIFHPCYWSLILDYNTIPKYRFYIYSLSDMHSFPQITSAGSGANGAIIHYKPEPESCSRVDPQKLFLLDSGAQYVDGTTDITRTVHFSEPSAREKECFTRVLQVEDWVLFSPSFLITYLEQTRLRGMPLLIVSFGCRVI